MSFTVKLDLLSKDHLKAIDSDLVEKVDTNGYGDGFSVHDLYVKTDENLYLPFSYFSVMGGEYPPTWKLSHFPATFEFRKKLREEQVEYVNQILHGLFSKGAAILSLATGMGKTFSGLFIAAKLGLRTCVLVHRQILQDQWIEAIRDNTSATVGKKLQDGHDITVCTWQSVCRHDAGKWAGIGLVIADEAHRICTEQYLKALHRFHPRYLLGLTATPDYAYLKKGMEVFFGMTVCKKQMNRNFTVTKITTEFQPRYKTTVTGKLDWNTVLTSLSENKARNALIRDIVLKNPERHWLIVCKRVEHCKTLQSLLSPHLETTLMAGKWANKAGRVIIGTVSKIGEGFDCPRLNAVVFAADLVRVEQVAGRVFRTLDVDPLIYDIVDKNSVLEKHWLERRKWYISRGGKIVIKNGTSLRLQENGARDRRD